MAKYKTYKKEKWLYLIFSIVAYFVPFVVVTAALMPMVKAATGVKVAMGLAVVALNALCFVKGLFRVILSHLPMLNTVAFLFLLLAAFFTMDLFQKSATTLCWIELAAGIGSMISSILWLKYCKYKKYQQSVKATIGSGAFQMKEE